MSEVPNASSPLLGSNTERRGNRSSTFQRSADTIPTSFIGVERRSQAVNSRAMGGIGFNESILSIGHPADSSASKSKKKKKKKKKGMVLNFDSTMQLECQVQMNLIMHNLAHQHYKSRNIHMFVVPQALLTMLTSILAFSATSSLLSDFTKTLLSTITGSTSGVVVFLQTMSGVCNYGTCSAMHASAAIDLRDLRDEIVLIKFRLKKEQEQEVERELRKKKAEKEAKKAREEGDEQTAVGILQAADDDSSDSDDSDDEDNQEKRSKVHEAEMIFGRIQQRYRQSLSGCKSHVPMSITEAFQGLLSNLLVSECSEQRMYMREIYGPKVNYKNIIRFKAFDILTSKILSSPGFPVILPNSRKVVDAAIDHLHEELDEFHKYWDDQLDKQKLDALEEARFDELHKAELSKNLRASQAYNSYNVGPDEL